MGLDTRRSSVDSALLRVEVSVSFGKVLRAFGLWLDGVLNIAANGWMIL